jgi:hypothetical protein
VERLPDSTCGPSLTLPARGCTSFLPA